MDALLLIVNYIA